MQKFAFGILAAIVMSASGHAATITDTTAIVDRAYSPQSSDDQISVALPDFNTSLGSLLSVTFQITGQATDSLVGENGNSAPFSATFTNRLGLGYTGVSFTTVTLSQDTGVATTSAATNGFNVNFSTSTTNDLSYYTASGSNEVDFQAYSTVSTFSGQPVDYSDDTASFNGMVTETYTYTPIPEPASVALLSAGLLGLIGITCRSDVRRLLGGSIAGEK